MTAKGDTADVGHSKYLMQRQRKLSDSGEGEELAYASGKVRTVMSASGDVSEVSAQDVDESNGRKQRTERETKTIYSHPH